MNKLFVLIFTFLILVITNASSAVITKENASVLIKKINEEMSLCKHYSADIEYLIFKSHTDSLALEKSNGYYKRSGTNEHSMLIGIETIQNETERLVVDVNAQSMVLSKPSFKAQFLEQSMQGALALCKTLSLTKNEQSSVLEFILDRNSGIGFSKLYITYNNETHFIENITMHYTATLIPGYEEVKSPKISISYSNISTSRIGNSEFRIDHYIQTKNNTYILDTAFKDYNLFNQLSTGKN